MSSTSSLMSAVMVSTHGGGVISVHQNTTFVIVVIIDRALMSGSCILKFLKVAQILNDVSD
jgi:hypothetical protein